MNKTKAKKSSNKSNKSSEPNLYYTKATWSRRIRGKLERGDPPWECGRYSHQKDQYPKEVTELIRIAEVVQESTKLLSTLTRGTSALLNNSVGKKLPSSRELASIVDRLKQIQPDVDVQITDLLLATLPKDK